MTKQAVVIAIDYKGSPIQLTGCEVDGSRMTAFFQSQGYEVKVLSATAAKGQGGVVPTRVNVLAAITNLAKTPGLTHAAIFYAGHGTQLPSTDNSETDGCDECLVCESSRGPTAVPGRADLIVDGEILAILRERFASLPVELFLMFDACHSGTICDLGLDLGRDKIWKPIKNGYLHGPGDKCRTLCFSAADDSECAMEAGSGGGLMTNKFLKCAVAGDLRLSAFCAEFATMGFQTPQISAAQPTSLDSVFAQKIIPGSGQVRIVPSQVKAPARVRRGWGQTETDAE